MAPGLEHAIAGTSLFVVGPDDDEEELKDAVMEDMTVSHPGYITGVTLGLHTDDTNRGYTQVLQRVPSAAIRSCPMTLCGERRPASDPPPFRLSPQDIFDKVDKSGEGVCVQVSTSRQRCRRAAPCQPRPFFLSLLPLPALP